MPTPQLNSAVRIFKSKEYGRRVLFTQALTNPRDKLGKLGVT